MIRADLDLPPPLHNSQHNLLSVNHRTRKCLNPYPSVSPAPRAPSSYDPPQRQLIPVTRPPSHVDCCSSEKPHSYSSKHNQFLLHCRTMWPLQPLTLSSILLPFAEAAPGCATQMGLSSAMKWARSAPCISYVCAALDAQQQQPRQQSGVMTVRYIPLRDGWESARDEQRRFRIPVCQSEGRSAV